MKKLISIVGSCLLIAACGGGPNDKDDNSDNGSPVNGSPVNGSPVDGGPVDGGPVDGGPVDGGPVDGGPVDGGPVDGNEVAITADNASDVASEVLSLLSEASDTGSIVEDAVFSLDDDVLSSQTVTCANPGGSITTTVTDADANSSLSAGDSVLIQYQNCDEAEDQGEEADQSILNGSLSLEVLQVRRDVNDEIIGFQVRSNFTNLSIADPSTGETSTIDGDMSLEWADNGTTLQTKQTGQSLKLTSAGEDSGTETLLNYTIDSTENITPVTYSTDANGGLDSTFIGFPVNFDILVPLQRIGDADFHSGVIVITGADGSKVQVTAVDNINVRLEVDADGDNVYENTIPATWEELGS